MIHVAIIGGGPAGMSCALWLKNFGFNPCLFERAEKLGGAQLQNFLQNDWVLGQRGMSGPQIAINFQQHVVSAGIDIIKRIQIKSIKIQDSAFVITHNINQTAPADKFDAVVIAAGTRPNGIEILRDLPGISSIPPSAIVVGPQAFRNIESFCNEDLLILGAGDNAFEFSKKAALSSKSITLLARSEPRAQKSMQEHFYSLVSAGVAKISKHSRIISLNYDFGRINTQIDTPDGVLNHVADRLIVQAGYQANSDQFLPLFSEDIRKHITLDTNGYLVADDGQRTTCRGIYAAGDICNPRYPCVVTAISSGCIAARSIELDFRKQL